MTATTAAAGPHAADGGGEDAGLRNFLILWSGQFCSGLGSSLTAFALAVWAFQSTGAVTLFSLIVTAATVPALIMLPFAGAVVDRYSRRGVMLVADACAASATGLTALLIYSGSLQFWHILVLVTINATAGSFQHPAYLAAVPMLVPERLLGRASGLNQLKQALGTALAPVIAGVLLVYIGLVGILIIDLATFFIAVATLLWVRIPQPKRLSGGPSRPKSLLGDVREGWSYLAERPGLLRLLVIFGMTAFLVSFANVLYSPLMLTFTSSAGLGIAVSTGATGMVFGSILVTTRGLPKRKVPTMLGALFLGGLFIAGTGVWASVPIVTALIFTTMFILPFGRGADQVLWQTKLAPAVHGRVFALRGLVFRGAAPIAFLAAGPLADRVFEPLLAEGGALAGSVGRLIGVGPGRGIGLMFVIVGLGTALLAVTAYASPRTRHVEDEIPDQLGDELVADAEQPVADAIRDRVARA